MPFSYAEVVLSKIILAFDRVEVVVKDVDLEIELDQEGREDLRVEFDFKDGRLLPIDYGN